MLIIRPAAAQIIIYYKQSGLVHLAHYELINYNIQTGLVHLAEYEIKHFLGLLNDNIFYFVMPFIDIILTLCIIRLLIFKS